MRFILEVLIMFFGQFNIFSSETQTVFSQNTLLGAERSLLCRNLPIILSLIKERCFTFQDKKGKIFEFNLRLFLHFKEIQKQNNIFSTVTFCIKSIALTL